MWIFTTIFNEPFFHENQHETANFSKTARFFYSIQGHFPAIQALKAPFIAFLLHSSFHLYILRAEM